MGHDVAVGQFVPLDPIKIGNTVFDLNIRLLTSVRK